MIKFKILCLICLCFVLSKVIGVEKSSRQSSDVVYGESTSSSKKVDNLVTRQAELAKEKSKREQEKSKQEQEKRKQDQEKSNREQEKSKQGKSKREQEKKSDKIKLKDEQFQVLKGGGDLQLQKNSVQNSFQAVYGQAFIVDDPVSKVFEKTKVAAKPAPPKLHPIKPPIIKPIKPTVKENPPIYHYNKRAIVYQCCRYVFPAELYYDHLLFYSKYGQTFSAGDNSKPAANPQVGHPSHHSNNHPGHHLGHHFGHLGHQLSNPLDHGNQLADDQTGKQSNQLSAAKKELEKEAVEPSIDEKKEPANINEKLVSHSGRTGGSNTEKPDHSSQPNGKSEQPNESEEDSGGESDRSTNEKSNGKDEKANGKSGDKANDEPDEAATHLFKSWTMHNKQLYNFGSCTPIYDLSQTNLQGGYHPQSRWPVFG